MTSRNQVSLFPSHGSCGLRSVRGGPANLFRVFSACSNWEKETGLVYYPRQRERLEKIAQREGFPLDSVVGIFCALSPNNTEDGTYRGTVGLLRVGVSASVSTYMPNRIKANRIREGEAPLKVLSGRKVRSFYLNTMDPDGKEFVTVDGHIFSCWKGRRFRLTDVAHKINDRIYTGVESDVKVVASMIRAIPCRLQSILWLKWRRMNGILRNDQMMLFPEEFLPENNLMEKRQ